MVNYLYDLSKISQNVELFSKEGEISANTTIKSLSRQAGRNIMQKGKAKEFSQ
jgi:malonyl-CoA decarboxylase